MVRLALLAVASIVLAACAPNGQGVGAVAAERSELDVSDVAADAAPVTSVARGDSPSGSGATASQTEGAPETGSDIETSIAPGTPRPLTVAVVGDSLTLSAEDEIIRALNAEEMHVLAIDGVESRRMIHGDSTLTPGVDAIERIRTESEPGLWVIALGTNDVASVGSADGFRDQMREVLELVPDDDPVVWVDLWIEGQETSVSDANRQIRSELRRRSGGGVVVDWYSHGTEDGIITGDGVHLTELGQDLYATSIAAAIDEMVAP